LALGDPPQFNRRHHHRGLSLVDQAPFRQPGRQPAFQVRPDVGQLTVTPTTDQLVDARSAIPTFSQPSMALGRLQRRNRMR
jgi:hypothetical protein